MTNEIATRQPAPTPQAYLSAQIEKSADRFALPSTITFDAFKNAIVSACSREPRLFAADRSSLFLAACRAASDGLMPDGHEAALVAYGGKVQYLPMVAGVIKRMYQSGAVAAVQAFVVYENDEFEIIGGTSPDIKHRPTLGPRGRLLCAYANATTSEGGSMFEFLHSEDIEKIRRASKSSARGPWIDWTEQVWKKSALHRLAKCLPQSRDVVQILDRDAGYGDVQRPQHSVVPQDDVEVPDFSEIEGEVE